MPSAFMITKKKWILFSPTTARLCEFFKFTLAGGL